MTASRRTKAATGGRCRVGGRLRPIRARRLQPTSRAPNERVEVLAPPTRSLLMVQKFRLSRRAFVQGAATALAASLFVPAYALGRDGKTAPSERITVGFIGCGKMANDYHLPELLKAGDVQALAVCEVDAKRREHAKKRVEKAYSG